MFISMSYWTLAGIFAVSFVLIMLLSIPERKGHSSTLINETLAKPYVRSTDNLFFFLILLPVAYFLHGTLFGYSLAPLIWVIRAYVALVAVVSVLNTIASLFSAKFFLFLADLIFTACSALMFMAI